MVRKLFVICCAIICSLGAKAGLGITDFSARADEDSTVALSWTSRLCGSGLIFSVYHSTDGLSWTEIERIPAPESDKGEQRYSSLHKTGPGMHYYRLGCTPETGTPLYSNTVFTEVAENLQKLIPFPNPVNDLLFVSCNDAAEAESYALYNATGDKKQNAVFSYFGQGLYAMDLSGLSPGFYFLRSPHANHRILVR